MANNDGYQEIKIREAFYADPKDVVFANGVPLRLKRKYGKFKREIIKVS